MKIAEQIEIVIQILESFNPAKQSINTHTQAILAQRKHTTDTYADEEQSSITKNATTAKMTVTARRSALMISEEEHSFISQTTCGVIEYAKLFAALVDLLYAENPNLNPAHKTQYKVFFYFVFFELKATNFRKLRFVLEALNSTAILPFLRLIFEKSTFGSRVSVDGDTKLAKVAKAEVRTSRFYAPLENVLVMFFSEDHVAKLVENVLDANYENALQMIGELSKIFEFSVRLESEDSEERTSTVAHEFQLTQAQGAVKYEVKVIDNQYRAQPYEPDGKTVDDVMQEREEAFKQRKAPVTIPDEYLDKFVHPPKRPQPKREQAEVVKLESKPPKQVSAAEPPKVTVTKTEILRENKLLEKKKKEAAEELEKYANGLHDSYEYDSWREAMLKRDEMTKEIVVEQNKVIAKQSLDMAKNSKILDQEKRKAVVTQQNVQQMEQIIANMEQKENEDAELAREAQELKLQTAEALLEAKTLVMQEKQQIKEEVQQEQQEMLSQAKDEELLEQLEKVDLVKQIKALLQVSAAERYIKIAEKYDPAETEGVGLLDEMSLVELRERLSEIKKMKKQLEDEKRQAIMEQKEQEAEELREKEEEVERVKQALSDVRKQNYSLESAETYKRVLKQTDDDAAVAREEVEEQAKRQAKRLQSQIEATRLQNKEPEEKLAELKEKMNAMKQGAALTRTFHANEGIPPKPSVSAAEMEKRARETELRSRKLYTEQVKCQTHEEVKEMLQTNAEREKLAQEIEQEQMEERRALVRAEKEKQKEQERKLTLENMYKAKAMGKEVDEVFL